MDTEQILLTTADRLAIIELANVFENAFDTGQVDEHMQVWVDDLVFESPFGTYTDRNAYRQWVDGFIHTTRKAGGTRHLITNNVIKLNGNSATAMCYLVIVSPKLRAIIATSVFEDELVKINGSWKFKKRKLSIDQSISELASMF